MYGFFEVSQRKPQRFELFSSGCKTLSERLVWQRFVAMLESVTSLSYLLIAFTFSFKHFDTSLIAGSKETSAGFLLRRTEAWLSLTFPLARKDVWLRLKRPHQSSFHQV